MNSSPGRFGPFGGAYVPEILMQPILDLNQSYVEAQADPAFNMRLQNLLQDYVGRETPLYFAERLSAHCGGRVKIYLKREDLNHTGAHKINNALGQILLALRMGKKRIVAETGAGQHGVATATVAARFGLECIIYMGQADIERQSTNVQKMKLLGAEVRAVRAGSKTLKDAVNEALRDWVTNCHDTYYLLGSALGPHPYPTMVRDFQSIIGREARRQIMQKIGRLPDELIACVGGGSNAIGLFHPFIADQQVAFVGVEGGGQSLNRGEHAARFQGGARGIFQGSETFVLQTPEGQTENTRSISAGLDYAAVGPEHSYLRSIQRATYVSARDDEALAAFHLLSKLEGIIPALESAHAVATAIDRAQNAAQDFVMIVNLSGRGDKDLDLIQHRSGPTL